MAKYHLEFEIKGLPRMTNTLRGSWRRTQGNATKWKRAVWKQVWPLKPERPLKKAKVTLIRCSAREPDFDGLASGFKPIIDGLVEFGILADDRMSVIGRPEYLWQATSPKSGHIKVKVEEL